MQHKKFLNIFFDLDGTLTDSAPGIINSRVYALSKYNISPDKRLLYKFIGPPLRESFAKYYGFSGKQIEEAIAFYREYFSVKGIYENSLYDGIKPLLESLKSDGRRLYLATSKPHEYAVEVLKNFGIYDYFTDIGAASFDGSHVDKVEILHSLIKRAGINRRDESVMIGDRLYDIIAAKSAGFYSIGVLYGYGEKEELTKAGADFLVQSVTELLDLLL